MKNFLSGQDLSIEVLFEQDLDPVVPDVASVTYDLYDNGGSKIATAVAVTTTTATTSVAIPIVGGLNTKAGGLAFEMRKLVVNWLLNGASNSTEISYRLISSTPMAVSAQSARSLVGMSKDELPDDDLDMYGAYVEVQADIGAGVVATALSAGDKTTLAVNRMIAVRSLINVLGSIQMRALVQDKSNTAQVSRFDNVDFVALALWLNNLYQQGSLIVVPVDITTVGTGLIMGRSSPTTDFITSDAPIQPGDTA